MMAFQKIPTIKPSPNPCLHCPDPEAVLDMRHHIAVGFGSAYLEKDGKCLWDEGNKEFDETMTVKQAEGIAAKDPDHDYRIHLHGPLHGEVYQRQGKARWVLIEKDEGFA
jgi:hypothetical protein